MSVTAARGESLSLAHAAVLAGQPMSESTMTIPGGSSACIRIFQTGWRIGIDAATIAFSQELDAELMRKAAGTIVLIAPQLNAAIGPVPKGFYRPPYGARIWPVQRPEEP